MIIKTASRMTHQAVILKAARSSLTALETTLAVVVQAIDAYAQCRHRLPRLTRQLFQVTMISAADVTLLVMIGVAEVTPGMLADGLTRMGARAPARTMAACLMRAVTVDRLALALVKSSYGPRTCRRP